MRKLVQLFRPGATIVKLEKPIVMHLATSYVNKLVKMCRAVKPLWSPRSDPMEVLNVAEYAKLFPWEMNTRQLPNKHLRTEAFRETIVVIMNSITLSILLWVL